MEKLRNVLSKTNLYMHKEDDTTFHVHEHYHGGKTNIIVTTIGMVMHSLADGIALGTSLFCKSKNSNKYDV